MLWRFAKWLTTLMVLAVVGFAAAVEWRVVVPPPRPAAAPTAIDETRLTYPYGDDLAVVRVAGDPYTIGWQQGRLVGERVRAGYRAILDHVAEGVEKKLGLPAWATGPILDFVWWRGAPFVPDGFKEEMVGLADGAGISYRTVCRVHAIPTLTEASCASFAATSPTTRGPLIQLRNLDWAVESGIQRFAQLTVVEPTTGEPFVNIGWSGFLGAVSGINRDGVSIAEITARSAARSMAGEPMVVRLRRVLQESSGLDEAVAILSERRRTLGFNFVVAAAREDRAAAVESNQARVAVFRPGDPRETTGGVAPFARTVAGVVLRSSLALDDEIRDEQLALDGDPARPGLEPPRGSGYAVRYVRQADLLRASAGGVTVDRAKEIARAIAPPSNLHSVIYAYPYLHVANAAVAADDSRAARDAAKAARQPYRTFDLRDWFTLPPPLPGTHLAAVPQGPPEPAATRIHATAGQGPG
jgi:hypothetical protein